MLHWPDPYSESERHLPTNRNGCSSLFPPLYPFSSFREFVQGPKVGTMLSSDSLVSVPPPNRLNRLWKVTILLTSYPSNIFQFQVSSYYLQKECLVAEREETPNTHSQRNLHPREKNTGARARNEKKRYKGRNLINDKLQPTENQFRLFLPLNRKPFPKDKRTKETTKEKYEVCRVEKNSLREMEGTLPFSDRNRQTPPQDIKRRVIRQLEIVHTCHDTREIIVGDIGRFAWLAHNCE